MVVNRLRVVTKNTASENEELFLSSTVFPFFTVRPFSIFYNSTVFGFVFYSSTVFTGRPPILGGHIQVSWRFFFQTSWRKLKWTKLLSLCYNLFTVIGTTPVPVPVSLKPLRYRYQYKIILRTPIRYLHRYILLTDITDPVPPILKQQRLRLNLGSGSSINLRFRLRTTA